MKGANHDAIVDYANFARDEPGYEAEHERLFALLVDVALAYHDVMFDDDQQHRVAASARLDVVVLGLRENLEMVMDDREGQS